MIIIDVFTDPQIVFTSTSTYDIWAHMGPHMGPGPTYHMGPHMGPHMGHIWRRGGENDLDIRNHINDREVDASLICFPNVVWLSHTVGQARLGSGLATHAKPRPLLKAASGQRPLTTTLANGQRPATAAQ